MSRPVTGIFWLPLVAIVAFAAGILVYWSLPRAIPERPEIAGFVLGEPRALPAFTLIDGDGNPFRTEDFRNAWSFVYFGFTYCPDICPMSMAVLANVKRRLEERNIDDHYYLVSVDPRRDTPDRMQEYVRYFDPDFRGLTGPADELGRFATAAGIVYEVPEQPQDENYSVGHSSTVTLINPDGNIQAFLTEPFDAEQIAADFVRIQEYYSAVHQR